MRRPLIPLAFAAVCSLGVLPATASAATNNEILLSRPLVPTDEHLFTSSVYPNLAPYPPAGGTAPTEAQARSALRNYLQAQYPNDPAAINAGLAVFDSAKAKAKIPDPRLRESLVGLKAAIGEPAINWILNAKKPNGHDAVTKVVFQQTDSESPAESFINRATGDMYVAVNTRYRFENPFLYSHYLAFEPLHTDLPNGAYEEATGLWLSNLIYLQQIAAHPALALGQTELTGIVNVYSLTTLNSGAGARLGLYDDNRNRPILPGSNQDWTAFWQLVDPNDTRVTDGNALLGRYLKEIHSAGAPTCSASAFNKALLDCIDKQGNAGLTSAELVKAAKAMKLDTNVERRRSVSISYGHSNFTGKLTSQQKPCTRSQSIAVYRQKSGTDPKVGSDTTDSAGGYSVREPGAKGTFYAKAPRSTVAGTGVCLEAKSRGKRVG
jgi:hypothetical protein